MASKTFSVVVASLGRPGPLSACLRAVLSADFPPDRFEIVVVDDGSPEALQPRVPLPVSEAEVRWIRLSENVGPAAARNEGARAAQGTYLAFIDDDCLAGRAWLERLLAALEDSPGAAVGGGVADGGGDLCCAADQTILDVAYAHYNADPSHARFFAALNLAVPAEAFRQIGGFDPHYRTAEDREFCARWLASGRRLVSAPDALVVHDARSSPGRFWRRHYAFGKGAYRFRSRHAKPGGRRMRFEPAAYYRRMLLEPLRHSAGPRGAAICGLVALSQVASALGFLAASRSAHTSNGRTA